MRAYGLTFGVYCCPFFLFCLMWQFHFVLKVLQVYPLSWENAGFLLSLAIVLGSVIVMVLALSTNRYTLKGISIVLLMVSAFTNYFMQTYAVIIDETMIQNTLETNIGESLDLLSVKLLVYLFFLGLVPSWVVYKTPIVYGSVRQEWWAILP